MITVIVFKKMLMTKVLTVKAMIVRVGMNDRIGFKVRYQFKPRKSFVSVFHLRL